jgi:hypothetical protein
MSVFDFLFGGNGKTIILSDTDNPDRAEDVEMGAPLAFLGGIFLREFERERQKEERAAKYKSEQRGYIIEAHSGTHKGTCNSPSVPRDFNGPAPMSDNVYD